jgi:hypothetical protein
VGRAIGQILSGRCRRGNSLDKGKVPFDPVLTPFWDGFDPVSVGFGRYDQKKNRRFPLEISGF